MRSPAPQPRGGIPCGGTTPPATVAGPTAAMTSWGEGGIIIGVVLRGGAALGGRIEEARLAFHPEHGRAGALKREIGEHVLRAVRRIREIFAVDPLDLARRHGGGLERGSEVARHAVDRK